jgi:hypothetical protein
LLDLATLLVVLVAVEMALNLRCGAVEQADRRPEEIPEVGLEARVAQDCDEGVGNVGQDAFDGALIGQGTGIGLVLIGAMAVELQLLEDAGGGGGARKGLNWSSRSFLMGPRRPP